MEYILKSILCSLLFILVYKVLFEREKMFVFNRFYLLISLSASLLLPLLTFQLTNPEVRSRVIYPIVKQYSDNQTNTMVVEPLDLTINWWIPYALITSLLLIRFLKNVWVIVWKIKKSVVITDSVTIVLLEKEGLPYSFMNYIFVHTESYHNQRIEPQIWHHELTHIRQMHTLDILFVELLQVFWWFNPCVYLYRRSIKMNHEFLADEAVLSAYPEVKYYQRLLVSKVSQNVSFTSAFNYSITKKRLLMMTKMTSRIRTIATQLATIPILGIAVALFGSIDYAEAQVAPAKLRTEQDEVNTASKEGVSDDLLKEYQSIVDRSWLKGKNGYEIRDFSRTDRSRMKVIYDQMSQKQKEGQEIQVRYIPLLKKKSPTQKELDTWKNPKINGIWIDGKRVSNEVLNKYKPEDFSVASISKLEKNAINYGKHYYQVDLMTNQEYEKDLEEKRKQPLYVLFAHDGDWTRKVKK